MATQGSYQTPPPPPQHMHGGYKMGPSPVGPGGPQNMPPYPPPQSQQYSQGNYSPRPQYGYGPAPGPGGQPPPPPPNSMSPGPGQYPGGRAMPNHVAPPPPHSQFSTSYQSWGPPGPQSGVMMNNHVQGKGGVPPPSALAQQPPQGGSPRPPINYLKQHLQHKGGYGGAPSPTPPQGYGNGPGMHPPMGPPHHMGPPMGPTNMGPPSAAPQNQPPVTGGAGVAVGGLPNSHMDGPQLQSHPDGPQDNGVSSSGPGVPHPVTSLVTTGPDGAQMDEGSQQSTLSNTSAGMI